VGAPVPVGECAPTAAAPARTGWGGRSDADALPRAGGKVAKVESKMATRLPSTGLKMAKMANLMVMGDTSDTLDRSVTFPAS
jgi:hypothetical protein